MLADEIRGALPGNPLEFTPIEDEDTCIGVEACNAVTQDSMAIISLVRSHRFAEHFTKRIAWYNAGCPTR